MNIGRCYSKFNYVIVINAATIIDVTITAAINATIETKYDGVKSHRLFRWVRTDSTADWRSSSIPEDYSKTAAAAANEY